MPVGLGSRPHMETWKQIERRRMRSRGHYCAASTAVTRESDTGRESDAGGSQTSYDLLTNSDDKTKTFLTFIIIDGEENREEIWLINLKTDSNTDDLSKSR
jgi:hypothetical protein